jgi:hypothetical protein
VREVKTLMVETRHDGNETRGYGDRNIGAEDRRRSRLGRSDVRDEELWAWRSNEGGV